jgi:hypothetical protein
MVGRSQRHMLEVQGYDSSGDIGPGGGPAPTGISPDSGTIAAAGAVDRTIGTFTATGGQGPYTFSIIAAAGVSAQFVGNLLKSTVNPIGTVALHTMSIQVKDQRGMTKVENYALTLS